MKFREEAGRGHGRASTGSTSGAVHLENPESHLRWYFKYFLGNGHHNYWGREMDKSLFLLSITETEQQYRAILWATRGMERICLPCTNSKRSAAAICQHFSCLKVEKGPTKIKSPDLMQDLLRIEEQEGALHYKFGVLYKRRGQRTDNEILCNNTTGLQFERFLALLGEKVQLKGFTGFKGGLDVRNDTTGEVTYCTKVMGKEVMFHVSTLLPYTPDNPQQVERKRHIGNDIVNIVFQDEADEFDPAWFKSKMSHVFALVTYCRERDSYLLNVYNEENMRSYEPDISPEYQDHTHFRHLLLVKLMNGEKAVYETPEFIARTERTNAQLLQDIYTRYVKEDASEANQLRPLVELTDRIIETTPRIGRKKRSQQAALFQEKGQKLKFDKILSGHAPTSRGSRSPVQHSANNANYWRHDKVVWDYPSRIVCADFWGSYILIGTDTSLALIDTDSAEGPTAEICDILPKHIVVCEEQSIAIVRAEKGSKRLSAVYIFNLADMTLKPQTSRNYKRKTKQGRLEGSKGAHLMSHVIEGEQLLLAVAYRHTVSLYEWTVVRGQGQGWFNLLSSFPISEVHCMTLLLRVSGSKICLGTDSDFLMVDAESGCIESLLKHKEGTTLCITPVLRDTVMAEGVLLTYNNISVVEQFTLHPGNLTIPFLRWHLIPHQIHCSLPYFIAIGAEGLEMRLASNGSIVHSLELTHITYLSYKCPAIYFSIWHQGKSDIVLMPTSLHEQGSTSTINSTTTLPPEQVDASAVARDSSLRRSFSSGRSRAFTTLHTDYSDDFSEDLLHCLSIFDLRPVGTPETSV